MLPERVTLTFKTPDVIDQLGLSDEYESEDDQLTPLEYVKEKLNKWIDYGEIINVEFNLKEGTARVL